MVLISTVFVMFCCSTETVLYPLFLSEMFGKKFSGQAWGIAWASLYLGNATGAVIWGWVLLFVDGAPIFACGSGREAPLHVPLPGSCRRSATAAGRFSVARRRRG